jgi:7-carboxy-7-deazaguanine synthase
MTAELPELMQALADTGRRLTLETNGTLYRDIVCDLVSISPKLAGSTPWGRSPPEQAETHEKTRLNVPALASYLEQYDCQLKFVLSADRDLAEMEELLRRLPPLPPEKVMLMPLARTKREYEKQAPPVAALCLEKGYRFCPRLHVALWGSRRGR